MKIEERKERLKRALAKRGHIYFPVGCNCKYCSAIRAKDPRFIKKDKQMVKGE